MCFVFFSHTQTEKKKQKTVKEEREKNKFSFCQIEMHHFCAFHIGFWRHSVRSDSALNIKFDRIPFQREKKFKPFHLFVVVVVVGSSLFFHSITEGKNREKKGKEIGAKIYEDFFGFSGFCLLYSQPKHFMGVCVCAAWMQWYDADVNRKEWDKTESWVRNTVCEFSKTENW